ncbi:protein phosphatase 2C domain-containing protein [Streptomyces sp. LX-29]|uniref:PP2C family serine/threonine-protein phosphatase n=1 Tax=Streptomyces sp. LX-29 TaxID=2900152 RepID=UPI00240DF517|nr:PP2C family serine/threonine-protein phosphatase [Streptomyces sp. LX-29]WFB10651.1 protein phosphatase 2C domain-containing protein [Streptomyces sp. LX-29]
MDRRGTRWRTHGLSVAGYRHRRDGIPCQDAWQQVVAGPAEAPVTVLAVADGAGSRLRSDEGSKLAVALAMDAFARWASRPCPPGEAVHALLRHAYDEVADAFLYQTGDQADDFATTLAVLVLAPEWIGHLSVGDGFAIVRAGAVDGRAQFHLLPQAAAASEYSNETVFLTSPGAERWVRTVCVRDAGVDGALLSTDGLAQAALSRPDGGCQTPNASFAAAVLGSLDRPGPDPVRDEEELAALLRSDRLSALNADDKTLVRAVRP